MARPGESYVAYTYDYEENMGLKGMYAGEYDLLWLDTISGKETGQNGVQVDWGDTSWEKPAGFSEEVALYVKRSENE